jgi:hypothetical protein
LVPIGSIVCSRVFVASRITRCQLDLRGLPDSFRIPW